MSFSKNSKSEIMSLPINSPIYIACQLSAMIMFHNHKIRQNKNIEVFVNSTEYINYISDLVRYLEVSGKLFKYNYDLELVNSKNKKRYSLKTNLPSENLNCNNILDIDTDNIPYFLRGIFLSCGSIVDPNLEYRVEFSIKYDFLCDTTLHILNSIKELNLDAKRIKRKNNNIIYINGGEKVTDFLVYIGAKNCAMNLMQIKMLKEVRNNINRATNFETANISKVTSSATKQIQAIQKIKNSKGLEYLPLRLRHIAVLRLNNPYSSLSELVKISEHKLTKSGINHRLQNIISISKQLD